MKKKYFQISFFLFALLALGSCANLPELQSDLPNSTEQNNFQMYESLHFKVFAATTPKAQRVADLCEEIYGRIMHDTNLLSFKPKENYQIYVYSDQDEYHRQTGYPAWSGGVTVSVPLGSTLPSDRENRSRISIATYESPNLSPTLAHEITHLIFNEFMGFRSVVETDRIRWLSEGLATYEEFQSKETLEYHALMNATRSILKSNAMSFQDMIQFNPLYQSSQVLGQYTLLNRSYDFTNIHLWYWQAANICQYLIERQGPYNFYLLLDAIKNTPTFSEAFSEAYPSQWRNFYDFEQAWRQSL